MKHRELLAQTGVRDVDKKHEKEFAEWFKHHVSYCHPIIYGSHWHCASLNNIIICMVLDRGAA